MYQTLRNYLEDPFVWIGLPSWTAGMSYALLAVTFVIAKKLMAAEKGHDDHGWQDVLRAAGSVGRAHAYYSRAVKGILVGLDRWIGDNTMMTRGRNRDRGWLSALVRDGASPWTVVSYDRCLLLAVAYPILSLVAVWAFGNAGTLGTTPILTSIDSFTRISISALILMMFFGLWLGMRSTGWRSIAFLNVGAVAGAVAVAVAGAVAVAVAGAVAVAVAVAVAGAFAVAFAVAFAGAFAGAFAVAFAFAFAGAFAVAVAFADAFAVAFAFAFAVAGAVALYLLEGRIKKNGSARWISIFHLLFWFSILGSSIFFLSLSPAMAPEKLQVIIVFLCFLPLLNAPLDWLSLGLTRGLLRESLIRRRAGFPVLYSGLDLVGALLLTPPLAALVGVGLTIADWVLVQSGGSKLVDVPAVVSAIREPNGDHGHVWVYVVILSTLFPTAIHSLVAVIGLASGLLSSFGRIARRVHHILGKEKGHKDTYVLWIGPALVALTVTAVFLLLVAIYTWVPALPDGLAWLGLVLLDVAEWASQVTWGFLASAGS